MLSGGNIIFTTIISRIIIKRKIKRHHFLGCTFSLIGFIIVGYAGMLGSESAGSKYTTRSLVLGIILDIAYLFTSSLQSNIEELILRKKAVHVQRMIGLEGQFGLIWSFVVCVIASFIKCPDAGICHVRYPF